ncbi:MAG: DUF2795 domain-containing protein [Methanosarcina sp.]
MQTSPIEVQKALKDMSYPASKKDLIEHARKHKANDKVMEVLEDLPEKEYTNAVDVSKEFKGEGHEKGGRGKGRGRPSKEEQDD